MISELGHKLIKYLRENGPQEPYKLYPVLFPTGRFNHDRDHGSSKGGPSKVEVAVHFYCGRNLRGIVEYILPRDPIAPSQHRGKYRLCVNSEEQRP